MGWTVSINGAEDNCRGKFEIETLHVSDSFSVHHQQFFAVHTAILYVIQLASWIRTDRSVLILLASCMTYTIAVCTVKNC